jgi:radical SAM protein with 4Fe4S-binding SPASM domain
MKMRVGILTSGGDCPGLNATIRGVAKALYQRMGDKVEIIGILNGYDGLINGNYRVMAPDEFSGILTVGGTILGTKRTPFKMMRVVGDDKVDKVAAMKKTYKDAKLDCLLCLGGNGTHKTANLLSQEGLNIIGLPKTIDNDIFGTDVTFGFHTAVDIATDVIDRIHTTAGSHSRVMCIEVMGNKAGWLTLYSGIAGGADIILIPEHPYDIKKVAEAVMRRQKAGKPITFYHYILDLKHGPCIYKRISGCGSGTEYMAVTPWGDLYPCHQFVGDPAYKLGNVWDGVTNTALRDEFKLCNVYARPDCKDCWARLYCAGGCAANALHATGDIHGTYEYGCKVFCKRMECALMMQVAQRLDPELAKNAVRFESDCDGCGEGNDGACEK